MALLIDSSLFIVLIIAGCALKARATVVSTDEHFARVPGLAVRKTLPRF